MGDSNAWLLMPYMLELAKKSKIELSGETVPGSSIISWSGKKYAKQWWKMRKFKPDLIVVCLGTNDACFEPHVLKNEPPYLKAMLDRMPAPVIWLGPPKLPPKVTEGLKTVIKMLLDAKVNLLDSRDIDIKMWANDVHPTPEGRKVWSDWAWKNINKE
jgi:lysophospholipase L1-like esterase